MVYNMLHGMRRQVSPMGGRGSSTGAILLRTLLSPLASENMVCARPEALCTCTDGRAKRQKNRGLLDLAWT